MIVFHRLKYTICSFRFFESHRLLHKRQVACEQKPPFYEWCVGDHNCKHGPAHQSRLIRSGRVVHFSARTGAARANLVRFLTDKTSQRYSREPTEYGGPLDCNGHDLSFKPIMILLEHNRASWLNIEDKTETQARRQAKLCRLVSTRPTVDSFFFV